MTVGIEKKSDVDEMRTQLASHPSFGNLVEIVAISLQCHVLQLFVWNGNGVVEGAANNMNYIVMLVKALIAT